MSTQSHHDGAESHAHFVAPLAVYLGTFGALIVLTAITVGVTYIDLGQLNIVVALVIAIIKASLVVLFFMGLAWDTDRFNRVVFGAALLFLSLFFILTFPDLLYRDALDPVKGNPCTNPSAYCAKAPDAEGGPASAGHVDPHRNPARLYYGAGSSTGAAPKTSGVIVNKSAADNLPGGERFGHPPLLKASEGGGEHH